MAQSQAREGINAANPTRGQFLNIQALRALAAFLVVFVHIETLALRAGAAPHSFDFGNGGVDLFFVISGAIMVITTRKPGITAASFMAHRIARIVPFYWLVTLVVFFTALVRPELVQSTRASLYDLVNSLAFIPYQKGNGFIQPVVFVGWTLNYEMAFYLLFAAGLLAGRRIGLIVTGAALLAAAVIGAVARPSATIASFYTAPIVVEFGLGMALGYVLPALPKQRQWRIPASLAAIAALGFLLTGPSLWPQTDRLFIFGLPATVLVASALVLERSGAILTSPLAKTLGDASYSTYLTHFFVTQAVTKFIVAMGLIATWQNVLAGIAAFVLVGAVGIAVHRTVERPLSEAARRLIPSFRFREPSEAARNPERIRALIADSINQN